MSLYRHTQIGYLMIVLVGGFTLFLLSMLTSQAAQPVGIPVLLLLIAVLIIFNSLTTQVDAEAVTMWFGPRLLRRRFPLEEIVSFRAVRSPWYYGWGIRFFPGGTLYNVSGVHSVELVLSSGRRVRLGTDDPTGLVRAIEQVKR